MHEKRVCNVNFWKLSFITQIQKHTICLSGKTSERHRDPVRNIKKARWQILQKRGTRCERRKTYGRKDSHCKHTDDFILEIKLQLNSNQKLSRYSRTFIIQSYIVYEELQARIAKIISDLFHHMTKGVSTSCDSKAWRLEKDNRENRAAKTEHSGGTLWAAVSRLVEKV